MNSIYKALNNIFILARNTVSMFLPLKDTIPPAQTSSSQTTFNKDIYPHSHMTRSTATNSYYIYTKNDDSYPYDQKQKSPYASVKIKNNSNRNIDTRTDISISRLRKAVLNKGPNPKFHDKLEKKHRSEWPELWLAIDDLLKADE
jgi:hypothetical protein